MKKKKVLIIGSVPPPYHGTNISNKRILNSKVGKVYNLYHFDISDHRDLDNLGKADFLNVFLSFKNFIKLPFVLLRIKPDLIYLVVAQNLAFLRDGTFIVLSKIFSRARVIIHLRSSYFRKFYDKSNILIRKFFDFTLNKVDAAIVLGNNLKSIISKWIKNIEVIPNGTDFNPDISKRNLNNNDFLTISYLGNLYEFKGVLDLMIAAKIILKKQKSRIFYIRLS